MTIYNQDNNNTKFSKNANDDFNIVQLDELFKADNLQYLVKKHQDTQVPRLEMLEAYYLNRNTDILTAERRVNDTTNKADHRAVHNYAKYVSRFIVGYLTGNPITIIHKDEKTNEEIIKVNDINDVDAINSDLSLDLSIYGRAFEIVYRDEQDIDRFKVLDPKNTFIIYDYSLDKNVLAGVRYYTITADNNDKVNMVEVYTAQKIHYFKEVDGELVISEEKSHYYNEVPIIEYLNDRFKQGDFENVLTLIDLYDSAQSDTANYMTDINDAMLAIVGNVELNGDDAVKFRQANMIHIKPGESSNGTEGHADVKFIYKQYDVNGSEAYKTRLQRDIHKYTNTPDLNDENFSGVQSGESMKYKLFGLEQIRAIKERLFKKGLMKRYKLLFNNINLTGVYKHDYSTITIQFTPNLPKSLMESIEAFNALNGGISEQTRMSLLPFIDNPSEELQKMQEESSNEHYKDAFKPQQEHVAQDEKNDIND